MTKPAGIKTNSNIVECQEVKILQISNYPPPLWMGPSKPSFSSKEIRRRGIVCDVSI